MDISALTLKLLFLLTPGMLAEAVYKRLTITSKERSDFLFVMMAFIWGVFSYILLQLVYFSADFAGGLFSQRHTSYSVIKTFSSLSDSGVIPYTEIMLASILSICCGFGGAWLDNHKVINKVAEKFRLSTTYGEENLYTFFLASPDVEWVYVHDRLRSFTYFGTVQSFAEKGDVKEILLKDVTVYGHFPKQISYRTQKLYLCFPKDMIVIEGTKNEPYAV